MKYLCKMILVEIMYITVYIFKSILLKGVFGTQRNYFNCINNYNENNVFDNIKLCINTIFINITISCSPMQWNSDHNSVTHPTIQSLYI